MQLHSRLTPHEGTLTYKSFTITMLQTRSTQSTTGGPTYVHEKNTGVTSVTGVTDTVRTDLFMNEND